MQISNTSKTMHFIKHIFSLFLQGWGGGGEGLFPLSCDIKEIFRHRL